MSVPLRERLETTLDSAAAKRPERSDPRWWYLGGGILVGCLLTFVAVGSEGHFRLLAAPSPKILGLTLEPIRLTEGRVFQMPYAPYPTPLSRSDALQWNQASHPDRAIRFLLRNQLDRAIFHLEEAVRSASDEATSLSDLSAVYGERGRDQKRPEDFVEALDAAERAVAAAPALPEAAFNHALALENLFLDEEARKAWRHYLALDGSSDWAEEARLHLERSLLAARRRADPRQLLLQAISEGDEETATRLAREAQREAREVFEKTLLPLWAESVARGYPDRAERRLVGARWIADQLAERGGERIFQHIVQEMALVADLPRDLQKRSKLVLALCRLRQGQEALSQSLFHEALPDLEGAERELRLLESAAAKLARLHLAVCRFRLKDLPGAEALLEGLEEDRAATGFPSVEARRLQILGLVLQSMDRPSDALVHYRRALDLYRDLGETPNAALASRLMAESLVSLGQTKEAWESLYQALAWSRGHHDDQDVDLQLDILDGAVLATLADRRPWVALHFQNRLVQLTEGDRRPAENAWALLRRARIEVALGRGTEAKEDFDRALRSLQQVPAGKRKALAATIAVVRREIDEGENRAAAIATDSLLPGLLGARADYDFRTRVLPRDISSRPSRTWSSGARKSLPASLACPSSTRRGPSTSAWWLSNCTWRVQRGPWRSWNAFAPVSFSKRWRGFRAGRMLG
jgi:tetratricopeptide (TPR) repeat protein